MSVRPHLPHPVPLAPPAEATKAQAAALRRRIDLVIPVKAEPVPQEVAAAEQDIDDAAAYEDAVESPEQL